LNQQGAADVKGFIHHGIHPGVGIHLLAGNVAQTVAEAPGGKDKERHDDDAYNRETPFKGNHHRQYSDGLDDLSYDVNDGVADGILSDDDIIVQPAHQFTDPGMGEEAHGHTLQPGEKSHPQVVDNPFANLGIEPALPDADAAGGSG